MDHVCHSETYAFLDNNVYPLTGKLYRGVKITLYTSYISALNGGKLSASPSALFIPKEDSMVLSD
jgi:hypothetical protein